MGQQQLLLIVLSVIIVSIAVAVGVNRFQSDAMESNRQALISELLHHAALAQGYFRTPQQYGGGEQNFNGFTLTTSEQSTATGDFEVTATLPTGAAAVTAGGSISASATTIYIAASGRETGNDGTNPVKAFVTISLNTISSTILN